MKVKVEKKQETGKPVNIKDMVAIKLNGSTKIVHRIVADRLIAKKVATIDKDTKFEVESNSERIVTEVKD